MTLKIGDSLPACVLSVMADDRPAPFDTQEFFKDKNVVLFSVPGAFTPTCSARHLPGYVDHASQFFDKGIDAIVCMSVNDVFVMHAWGKSAGADELVMLADGNAEFASAMGLDLDARDWGMGIRSQRFALVANNGVVTHLFIEAPGEFKVSSAEHVLVNL